MKKSKSTHSGILWIIQRQEERNQKMSVAVKEMDPDTYEHFCEDSDNDFMNDVREELGKRLSEVVSDFESTQPIRGASLTLRLEDRDCVTVDSYDCEIKERFRVL
jgi:hypothetical protein